MDLADRKFLLGHDLEGSAMIWESVEQVVTAVAKQRGLEDRWDRATFALSQSDSP